MKRNPRFLLLAIALTFIGWETAADTRYVNQANTHPASPFATWATAATNIQDALNPSVSGDTVIVTNGLYQYGVGAFSSRIFVISGVTVQSVNGPAVTTILGYQVPGSVTGTNAIRCAYLNGNAVLSGFTLANGGTTSTGVGTGGGVNCTAPNALITNCIITGNTAIAQGGGVSFGTLVNCTLTGNTAQNGGGAYVSTLVNCVVQGNGAFSTSSGLGGGAYNCQLTNCVVTGNSAAQLGGGAFLGNLVNCTVVSNAAATGGSAYNSTLLNCISYYNTPDNGSQLNTFSNCCVTPRPLNINNFTNAPVFLNLAAGNYHLQIGSPCIDAGDNSYIGNGTDLDGNPRIANGTVDVGAYESQNTSLVHYVRLTSANPLSPYTTWTNAATNIQDAINAASAGDFVVVDSGTYASGSTTLSGSESNRIAITNGVSVIALNGPQATTLTGGSFLRCAYVGSNSFLSGFTITNGQTSMGSGIWCESGAVVSNCFIVNNRGSIGAGVFGGLIVNSVLTGNQAMVGGGAASNILSGCILSNNFAAVSGGGVYRGVLFKTLVSSNAAQYDGSSNGGGGVYQCISSNCTLTKNVDYNGVGGGSFQGTNFNCLIVSNNASNGGGTYQSTNYSCILSNNKCNGSGGGANGGLLYNCIVNGNIAYGGGGAYLASVVNCTIVGNLATNNSAPFGGGVANCQCYNSIIYYNMATTGSNYSGSQSMNYCCTAPTIGTGCVTNDPDMLDWTNGFYQLRCGSPCVDAGFSNAVTFVTTNDFRGLPRPIAVNSAKSNFDIGAFEYTPTVDQIPIIRNLSGYTNIATGYNLAFAAEIGACAGFYWWNFGDGSPMITNQSAVSHAWTQAGTYTVTLSFELLTGRIYSTTLAVQVSSTVYYVNASSSLPFPPYTSLATAARAIQPAINVSTIPGRLVLVTNGVYSTNGIIVYGNEGNTIVATNSVIVQSASGADSTVISAIGNSRCAYIGSNSVLIGFTLKNGRTISSGDVAKEQSGGGVWCEPGGVVSNCIITNCTANQSGGGAYQGTFYNCTFASNYVSQYGGGAFLSTLYNCVASNNFAQFGGGIASGFASNSIISSNTAEYGGGAFSNTLVGCQVVSNRAYNGVIAYGGGACFSKLTNCTVIGNSASTSGGGLYGGSIVQSLVLGNIAPIGGGATAVVNAPVILNQCVVYGNSAITNGGGLYSGDISSVSHLFATNCIVFGNGATNNPNYFSGGTTEMFLANCCTDPLPATGSGNIDADPLFVNINGDFHLQSTSPCINAGMNAGVVTLTDLDVNLRIVGATVDIGAYEFQSPSSVLSYAWAQQYGLPTDGSADYADADGDGLNNWQEWKAGTSPLDAASALRMLALSNSVSGATITWQSVSNITYYLQRSTNLASQPAFVSVASNFVAQAALSSYTDVSATNSGPYYYRVGVQ